MRPPRRLAPATESGFTLVELLMVMVVIAVIMAVAIPSILNTAKSGRRPAWIGAGNAIWVGIESYRVDHHGLLPPQSMLTGGGATFLTFDGGQKYVQHWPDSPTTSQPIAVAGGGGASPAPTGTPETIVYARSGNQLSGWLAVYDGKGRLALRRIITSTNGAAVPPLG